MFPLRKARPTRLWSPRPHKFLHTRSSLSHYSISPTRLALLGCGIAGGTWYLKTHSIFADAPEIDKPSRTQTPLSTLLRSYTVYALCSIPVLVDYSPSILTTLISIPGVKQVTEAIVRATFFAQFVGGDSAEDTIPLLQQLREENKGVLLAYSVEVRQHEAEGKVEKRALRSSSQIHKQNVEETIRCIDVAADFEDRLGVGVERKTWVAVKLTALLPSAQSLINLSAHLRHSRPQSLTLVPFPGVPRTSDLAFIDSGAPPPTTLTMSDVAALKELYADLTRIAERGQQRGVKIIVDAEYTWYQPAIDAFTLSLMRRFNLSTHRLESSTVQPVQPLVYATYQAYLRRTPSYIQQSIQDAKAGGYSLGIKLVRGAYHPFEVEAAPTPAECPVWTSKPETDACYDQCAAVLLSALKDDISSALRPQIGILFGTHNAHSCIKILDGLVARNVAEERGGQVVVPDAVASRCAIGQLFGMSDALTDSLVNKVQSSSPFIIKYVPYGPVSAVMPYLCRRAIENKSVLFGADGAAAERRRVGTEIRRRMLGF
ncbi:FAD-linked oxidoreductase-like protein [Hysterangium stoloniferum]|nr:FAD-linked oxidoreductase-like protein [Hysterangium stoloniferum]